MRRLGMYVEVMPAPGESAPALSCNQLQSALAKLPELQHCSVQVKAMPSYMPVLSPMGTPSVLAVRMTALLGNSVARNPNLLALAERGGLDPVEALAVLKQFYFQPWDQPSPAQALQTLHRTPATPTPNPDLGF